MGVSLRGWRRINSVTVGERSRWWGEGLPRQFYCGVRVGANTQSGSLLYPRAQRSVHVARPGYSSEAGRCLDAKEEGSLGATAAFPGK